MQKWEYLTTQTRIGEEGEHETLNDLGGRGWKLVDVIKMSETVALLYFIRPLDPERKTFSELAFKDVL